MLFNFGKCKCLHTGHGNLDVNYKMGDTVLSTTVNENDLGVTIYLSIKPDENWASERSAIEACVADVGGWMNRNILKLNQEKSELIVFSSKHRICQVNDLSLMIGGRLLHAVQSVRNCGVIMDSGLTMEKQVNAISKSCFYHIQNIGKVRQYITNDACKILVQALVTSRLDYGNALLQGLPQVLIERLQRIQNCAACLITRSRKSEHITPVLRELHWLPVKYWLRFKVNTFTYKVLNGLAPAYRVEKNHDFILKIKKIGFFLYKSYFFNLFDFFEIWYIKCHKIFYFQAIWCQYSYTSVRTLCFCIKKHTTLC